MRIRLALRDSRAAVTAHFNSDRADCAPKKTLRPKPTSARKVLIIGDKPLRHMRTKLLSQLPRRSSVLFRQLADLCIENAKSTTLELLKENQQEVHVMLHCGCNECMNFKKDHLLQGIDSLMREASSGRTNVTFSVATVPPFMKECFEFNTQLAQIGATGAISTFTGG